MIDTVRERISEIKNSTLMRTLLLSVALLLVSATLTIHFLQSSNFPGELEDTQLGFDGFYIKDCFSGMSPEDMRLFILGNLVDYVFMLSYGGLLFSAALLIARRMTGLGSTLGYLASILGALAAVSDGLENVFLISMALNPVNFPVWLAFPHSVFAHIKFNFMYASGVWVLLGLMYLTVRGLSKE